MTSNNNQILFVDDNQRKQNISAHHISVFKTIILFTLHCSHNLSCDYAEHCLMNVLSVL